MTRISGHAMCMSIASVVAERSTCDRLHVGAVIVRDGRVMSSGYNGNVSGSSHCSHEVTEVGTWGQPDFKVIDHRGSPCTSAVHAEANAILFSARHGVATEGADLFTTHQPCEGCAKLIINAGIKSVVFKEHYRLPDGLKLLLQSEVVVFEYLSDDSLVRVTECDA